MRMEEKGGAKCFPAGWSMVAKPCDYCKSASALLFCRTDTAFLCVGCDAKVHGSSRHMRVWMCEVCEQAPATVTCKADAAVLCSTCDRDIHSANPLARRHERSPVVPFYSTVEPIVKITTARATNFLVPTTDDATTVTPSSCLDSKINTCFEQSESVPSSWIPTTTRITSKLSIEAPDIKPIEFLFSETDHFVAFDQQFSLDKQFHPHNSLGNDSVVPVQNTKPPVLPQRFDLSSEKHYEIDFSRSKLNSYHPNFNTQSLGHSVSSSSMDVGVVPDGCSMSETSYPFGRRTSNGVDLHGSVSNNQSSQLLGMNREARVLRYREKRKNRKFEKTIRYASRKAYAETRPRVKGRFVKRAEVDSEADRIFTSAYVAFTPLVDLGYGVVPSF